MMLFAVELPDGTVYLVAANNVSAAIAEAERRSDGTRPAYVWTLYGVQRRKVT
jgi:hypothetical protein